MRLGQQASAVTLVENLTQPTLGARDIQFDLFWAGSSFTTGPVTYDLQSATLWFDEETFSPNLFLRLYSDDNGTPDTPLTSFTNPASFTTTFGNNTFTLTNPYALAASTTYWLVAGVSATPD